MQHSFCRRARAFLEYPIADASVSGFDEKAFTNEFLQGKGPDVMQLAAWSGGPIPPE
jgi:hypothetical protein